MQTTSQVTGRLDPAFVGTWAERYLAAWRALDADGVAALCSEDVVWSDPGLPAPAHGRDGVRAFVRATARSFPDFRVEEIGPPLIAADEPLVLSRYRMTGRMLGPWEHTNLAATGGRVDLLGVDEWTFAGELMCRYRTYYDSLEMARQLGIVPRVGSGADRMMGRFQHLQARLQRRRAARSRA